MKKELNRELDISEESLNLLIEELLKEELSCKGNVTPVSKCKVN